MSNLKICVVNYQFYSRIFSKQVFCINTPFFPTVLNVRNESLESLEILSISRKLYLCLYL